MFSTLVEKKTHDERGAKIRRNSVFDYICRQTTNGNRKLILTIFDLPLSIELTYSTAALAIRCEEAKCISLGLI